MKTKRFFVIAMTACLLFAYGCSPSPTAIHVGNHSIDASEFAFYLNYNKLNMENKYGYYAVNGSYTAEITDTIRNDALDQIVTAEIIRMKCKEFDVSITSEEKKNLSLDKSDLIESHGGKHGYLQFLKESAMTDRTYDKYYENSLLYDKLLAYITTDASQNKFNKEELRKFFGENYITVKYIRLSSTDDVGETLSEVNSAALLVRAEAILAEANAEGANFDALMQKYNDDLVMQDNPQGIVVSRPEAKGISYLEPLFDLADNSIGGTYKANDGYYIAQRLPVPAEYFDVNYDAILQGAIEWHFSTLLEQWKAETEISTTNVYKKINLTNLFDFVK